MVPTWTDNRENGSASTKFPSSAVVMELSCNLSRMAAKASVEWAPRSTNCEADALANGITGSFDPSRRIVGVKTLRWEILPKALSMGKPMEEDTEKCKSERDTNKPRKEAQATKAGGQNEDERSVVRCSCEGLASALRLTGQTIVIPQFAACRPWSKPRLIHSLHRRNPRDFAACWESAGTRLHCQKRVRSLERRNSGRQVTSYRTPGIR